jgi:hypothetical protein
MKPDMIPTIMLINIETIDNPRGKVDGKTLLMKKLNT